MLRRLLPAATAFFTAITPLFVVGSEPFPQSVSEALDEVFDSMANAPHVVNSVALVDAKNGRFHWARATGMADPKCGERMTIGHQFRTASVTKTFTGVLVVSGPPHSCVLDG
jgi:CubicO group peptidase (beta-lactamase class C family)